MTRSPSVPKEFEPETVRDHSAPEVRMYHTEVTAQEPVASVLASNPEMVACAGLFVTRSHAGRDSGASVQGAAGA